MNVSKRIVVTALSLAGALAAGAAQARGNFDVSVHIGSGSFVLGLPLPPLPHVVVTPSRGYSPNYGHAPVYGPAQVYFHGQVGYGRDRDRDGIPNRYDSVYNPRWDRDGDGVPNRYDRYPNHAGGGDRDRSGVPNWRDTYRGDNRGDRDRGRRDNRSGGRD